MEAGKEVIDEKELLRIITPRINYIDEILEALEPHRKEIISIKELAGIMKVSRKTLWKWVKTGIIEDRRIGGYFVKTIIEGLRLIKQRSEHNVTKTTKKDRL
jgi:phage antirepressor YoqD-like protein